MARTSRRTTIGPNTDHDEHDTVLSTVRTSRGKPLPVRCRLGRSFTISNHELVADFEITLRALDIPLGVAFEDMLADYVNAHSRKRRRWEKNHAATANAIRFGHGILQPKDHDPDAASRSDASPMSQPRRRLTQNCR